MNLIVGLVVIAVAVMAVYTYYPHLFRGILPGTKEHFANAVKKTLPAPGAIKTGAMNPSSTGSKDKLEATAARPHAVAKPPAPAVGGKEGFADYQSGLGGDSMGPVPMAAAQKPQGCYPREQLNPMDLLPNDVNSQWAQVNPQGAGDIQGKNFLSAGALMGVNTVGQSLRNPNYQLRAEPPCPQVQVGPWMQSTIEPDLQRRPLE